jgi:hypothetical protein
MKKHISTYNKHRVVDRDHSNPDFQTISTMYQYDPKRSEERMERRAMKLK